MLLFFHLDVLKVVRVWADTVEEVEVVAHGKVRPSVDAESGRFRLCHSEFTPTKAVGHPGKANNVTVYNSSEAGSGPAQASVQLSSTSPQYPVNLIALCWRCSPYRGRAEPSTVQSPTYLPLGFLGIRCRSVAPLCNV